jgi:hypothetical protein
LAAMSQESFFKYKTNIIDTNITQRHFHQGLQFLSRVSMKERLESLYLERIGLIPSSAVVERKFVRIKTSILYKQQKFNLLQEESEGFAMLSALFTCNLLSSFDTYQNYYKGSKTLEEIRHIRSEHLSSRVKFVLHSTISLIGYFDLSPSK